MKALCNLPIRELRQRRLAGELSAVALAKSAIAQRKMHDSVLNAYHLTNDEALLQSAQLIDAQPERFTHSPLAGLPMSAKSVIALDGYLCYAGGPQSLPDSLSRQGSVVGHLRSLGVTLSGVTHAAEFSVGGLGINPHWGSPRNPWDASHHRVAGGSSAGAGISVLEGSCVFALGTDTGGSVRVPASLAGVVGFKVSDARWPTDGVVPLASRFDTIGLFANCVADVREVATSIDAVAGELHDTAGFSEFGLSDFNFQRASGRCWQNLDPGIARVVEQALAELQAAGSNIQNDDNGLFAEAETIRDKGPNTASVEVSRLLARECPDLLPQLSLHVREFVRTAESISESQYLTRVALFVTWRKEVISRMHPFDIIVLPTVRYTPPTTALIENREEFVHYSDALLHNTVLPSLNGCCAVTIPVGLDDAGMPVGLQMVARKGSEYALLHAAELAEQQLGNSCKRLGTAPLLRV